MKRFGFALLLQLLVSLALGSVDDRSAVRFAIFPEKQAEVKIEIVGIRYRYDGIEFVLKNKSSKSITRIDLSALFTAPAGCSLDDSLNSESTWRNGEPTDVGPGKTFTVTHKFSPVDPSSLVTTAKVLHAAYLYVEVGIREVWFADGSHWRRPSHNEIAARSGREGECRNAKSSIAAIANVDGAAFAGDGLGTSTRKDTLQFSCELKGTQAVCPASLP